MKGRNGGVEEERRGEKWEGGKVGGGRSGRGEKWEGGEAFTGHSPTAIVPSYGSDC